jgi:carboxylesterase type B
MLYGKYLAGVQDFVVVAVDYRINVFGFPGAPSKTQIIGLWDQRAAVG